LDWSQPYPSRRSPLLARNAVAASQPLAAQAGLRMLLAGGNAVDAAIATAAALTVVEPTMNGLGSDAFAIVWDGQRLHGLNGSGRSPAGWTREFFNRFDAMPQRGWHAVTVPGAVSAWAELSQRFGKLAFEQLLAPAIEYARHGFPVSPIIGREWAEGFEQFRDRPAFVQTFAPNGRAPLPGAIFRSEAHAATLERIGATRGEAFYRGDLAERIAASAKAEGGVMTCEDLAAQRAEWVELISTEYGGRTLHEIPPNGQGIAALLALNLLRGLPLSSFAVDSVESIHLQVEAMKLAFADVHAHVSEPATMSLSTSELLDAAYAGERAKLIDPRRAQLASPGIPRGGDTVYLTAADASGMMVSFIQSNYMGFGSGVVVPGTGIALQNRGAGFTLERDHPNEVAPRKRPFHTIIPGFVTDRGRPLMSFGVMGGGLQPQGHVQMMTRLFDYDQNPQAASDAPRWRVTGGMGLLLERGISPEVADDLKSRGHDVTIAEFGSFGGAQLIYKLDDGYVAGSDHRKDGQPVGF
jgi:gamma-glutamyltranspeptidase/glutathione hydrolase